MEANAKAIWVEVAMDIIQEVSAEETAAILFRDNYRDMPYQDDPTVLKVAEILNKLNLDI